MTLEEAIKNFEQEIGEFEGLKKIHAVTHEDYARIEKTRQLAEWLKELKELREQNSTTQMSGTSGMVSRQAAIDAVDSETVSTNPKHFRSSEKFNKFMDDADIASFGKWKWAKGFNAALAATTIQLEKLPSVQSELEDKIRAIGYTGKEGRIYIGGRLFAVRELPQ